jgi:hypothetical protein
MTRWQLHSQHMQMRCSLHLATRFGQCTHWHICVYSVHIFGPPLPPTHVAGQILVHRERAGKFYCAGTNEWLDASSAQMLTMYTLITKK